MSEKAKHESCERCESCERELEVDEVNMSMVDINQELYVQYFCNECFYETQKEKIIEDATSL